MVWLLYSAGYMLYVAYSVAGALVVFSLSPHNFDPPLQEETGVKVGATFECGDCPESDLSFGWTADPTSEMEMDEVWPGDLSETPIQR